MTKTTDEWLWTDWKGGECPLADGVEYKAKFRNCYEIIYQNCASDWSWTHSSGSGEQCDGDITAYAIRNPNYVAQDTDVERTIESEPTGPDLAALLRMAEQALGDIVTRSYDDGMSKVIDMRDIAQTTLDKIRKAGVK